MSNKVPYLANGISFAVTKKRFGMMGKKSSRVVISIKSGIGLPILGVLILISCTTLQNRKQLSFDELTFQQNGDTYYSNNKLLMSSKYEPILYVKLKDGFKNEGNNIHRSEWIHDSLFNSPITYDENGDPYSGIQRVSRFTGEDSTFAIFEYKDGYQTKWSMCDNKWEVIQTSHTEFDFESREMITKHYKSNDELFYMQSQTFTDSNKTWRQHHLNGQVQFEATELLNEDMEIHPIRYHGYLTKYDEEGNILEQELWAMGELVEKIK